MKEINGKKFYPIAKIHKYFQDKITLETLKTYFENGKIKGEIIEGEWYANEKALWVLEDELYRDTINFIGEIQVNLKHVDLKGRILDIGGGGEGVIGQLKGEHVIAIDTRESELKEAPEGDYLKIVMDAKDMKFLDNTFDTVTAFFTLMYVPPKDRKQILREAFRVLKSSGEFFIWDFAIPNKKNDTRRFYGAHFEINIGNETIYTGYATHWDREQNVEDYEVLCREIGFEVKDKEVENDIFYLKLVKNT